MKHTLYLIVLFLFVSVSYAQTDTVASRNKKGGNENETSGNKPNLRKVIEELRADLEDLDDLITAKLSGRDKKKAQNYIDHAMDMVDDIEGMTKSGGGHGGGNGGGYYGLPPIPEPAFNEILDAVNREAFAADKLNILQITGRNGAFTISQIVRLIELFPFRDDKITVVRYLYPTSFDKYNAFKLIAAFTFRDDKDTVTKIINGNK